MGYPEVDEGGFTGVQTLIWAIRNEKLKAAQAAIMIMMPMRCFFSTAIRRNESSKLSLKPKMLEI